MNRTFTCLDPWPAAIKRSDACRWRCDFCGTEGTLRDLSFQHARSNTCPRVWPDLDALAEIIAVDQRRARELPALNQQVVLGLTEAAARAANVLRACLGRDVAVAQQAARAIRMCLTLAEEYMGLPVSDPAIDPAVDPARQSDHA